MGRLFLHHSLPSCLLDLFLPMFLKSVHHLLTSVVWPQVVEMLELEGTLITTNDQPVNEIRELSMLDGVNELLCMGIYFKIGIKLIERVITTPEERKYKGTWQK